MLARVVPLFAIIALGSLCAGLRVFPDIKAAIGVLNRFALYVGFPLLVVSGLIADDLVLPEGPGFYTVHVVSAAIMVIGMIALTRARPIRRDAGALTMGSIFGNIAYLGIPFCGAAYGAAAIGVASLSAALHIAIGMVVGPILLASMGSSGKVDSRKIAKQVASQPLVWSPVIGALLRMAPESVQDAVDTLAAPVGAAAGPVALFMLGLYLWLERRHLAKLDLSTTALTVAKLALYPLVAWGMLEAAKTLGQSFTSMEERVVITVAAMPVAITTFSIAEEFNKGQRVVARGIVLSTVIALATLPLLAGWLA